MVKGGRRFKYWSIMNTIYDDVHLSCLVLLCLTCCCNLISTVLEMLLVQHHAQSVFFYMPFFYIWNQGSCWRCTVWLSSCAIMVDVDPRSGFSVIPFLFWYATVNIPYIFSTYLWTCILSSTWFIIFLVLSVFVLTNIAKPPWMYLTCLWYWWNIRY